MKKLPSSDMSATDLTKKEKNLCYLVLLFFLVLYNPFKEQVGVLGMWPIFVYSFIFNTPAQKIQLLKKNRGLQLLIAFFIFNLLSILWSHNLKDGISWLGIRIALFVLPVALGTIIIRPAAKERIIYFFAGATTLAAVGCFLRGIYRAMSYHDQSLLYNDNLTDIIHLQSIYFAMLVNLAIFSYAWLWIKRSPQLNKSAAIVVILFLLVLHFLLASRVAIIILYSSIFIFACAYLIRRKKILEGATLLTGLLIGSFLLIKFFPKTINRFKELSFTQFKYSNNGAESHFNMAVTADQWNGANLRLAVWQCGLTVIRQNILFGVGLGDKTDALQQQYAVKGFSFGIRTHRNMHSNYLDVWLSMGITGLILFVMAFFIMPLRRAIKDREWLSFAIIICISFSMFSETYMDRTTGNILLGFFFGLLTAFDSQKSQADQ